MYWQSCAGEEVAEPFCTMDKQKFGLKNIEANSRWDRQNVNEQKEKKLLETGISNTVYIICIAVVNSYTC